MAFLREPKPCALVIPAQHLERTPKPVMNRILLNLGAEGWIADNRGAEYGEPSSEAEQFPGQQNGTHRAVAQAKSERGPFREPGRSFHHAIFIRRDGGNWRSQAEDRQNLFHQTRPKHRVAVEN